MFCLDEIGYGLQLPRKRTMQQPLDHETREISENHEKARAPFRVSRLWRRFEGFAIQTLSQLPRKRAMRQRLKQILQPFTTARLLRLQRAHFGDARGEFALERERWEVFVFFDEAVRQGRKPIVESA